MKCDVLFGKLVAIHVRHPLGPLMSLREKKKTVHEASAECQKTKIKRDRKKFHNVSSLPFYVIFSFYQEFYFLRA